MFYVSVHNHFYTCMAGTEDFIRKNPEILRNCITVSTNDITCNKDTGEGSKSSVGVGGTSLLSGHVDISMPGIPFTGT